MSGVMAMKSGSCCFGGNVESGAYNERRSERQNGDGKGAPGSLPRRLSLRLQLRLPAVAIAAVIVVHRELDALLEAGDPDLDVAGLAIV